jgi:hypothetical protein
MDTLHKERRFALIMGVDDKDGVILTYNRVMDKLFALENYYLKTNPQFRMIDMWDCSTHNGHLKFKVTRQCDDQDLKRKLLTIFNGIPK